MNVLEDHSKANLTEVAAMLDDAINNCWAPGIVKPSCCGILNCAICGRSERLWA